MAPSTRDIVAYVESLAGHPLNRDEGQARGPRPAPGRRPGVLVASGDALEAAARHGRNLVLAHESLYYPYNATDRADNPAGWEDWPPTAPAARSSSATD